MEPKLPPSGGLLLRPILDLPIRREDEHSFAELHVDIGKEPEHLHPGDFAHLLTELVPALRDQILPELLHHLDTFRGFRQLTFGWCQDAFQSDDHKVSRDECANFIRATTHEFLLEPNDGVAY
jgi:hypothetical protein